MFRNIVQHQLSPKETTPTSCGGAGFHHISINVILGVVLYEYVDGIITGRVPVSCVGQHVGLPLAHTVASAVVNILWSTNSTSTAMVR